jgi:6-phosphogluconolactonase
MSRKARSRPRPSLSLIRAGGLALWLALAGCGGSGGDGSSGSGADPDAGRLAAPTVITQPANASVTAGSGASFSVLAGGAGLSYQWQRSTDGGNTWTEIVAATAATLTLSTTAVGDNGQQFRVVVRNAGGSATSGAATLSVTAPAVPRFVYAPNASIGNFAALAIAASTGALTPVPGSPYRPLAGPLMTGISVHPTAPFVYVSLTTGTNGGLFGYRVDGSTGQLTALSNTVLVGGNSLGRAIFHPNGRFLYAPRDNGVAIEAHAVDASTGLLQPVPGSPFAAGRSSRLVLDDAGRYAYLIQADALNFTASLYAFSVDATTGALAPVAGSPYVLPPGALYGGIHVRPGGRFVYVTNFANKVVAYAVQPGSGALVPLPGSPYTISTLGNGGLGVAAVFEPAGKFVYFDIGRRAVGAPPKALYGYAIDATTGVLTPISGSPFGAVFASDTVGCGIVNAGSSPYLLQGGSGVAALAIDPGTGVLTEAAVMALPAGSGNACAVGLEPNGSFVYAAATPGLFGFRFNGSTGALTAISGAPWATGGQPLGLVFR